MRGKEFILLGYKETIVIKDLFMGYRKNRKPEYQDIHKWVLKRTRIHKLVLKRTKIHKKNHDIKMGSKENQDT